MGCNVLISVPDIMFARLREAVEGRGHCFICDRRASEHDDDCPLVKDGQPAVRDVQAATFRRAAEIAERLGWVGAKTAPDSVERGMQIAAETIARGLRHKAQAVEQRIDEFLAGMEVRAAKQDQSLAGP